MQAYDADPSDCQIQILPIPTERYYFAKLKILA